MSQATNLEKYDGISALIVEDEGIVALDLEAKLLKMGFHVCGIALSGSEALQLAKQYSPDIILMDINILGDMDGIEVACELRKFSCTPVIYTSAYPADTMMHRLLDTKPFEYAMKPHRYPVLAAKIHRLLSGH